MTLSDLRRLLAKKLKKTIRLTELQQKELNCFDNLVSRREFLSGSVKIASLSALVAAGRVPTSWGETITGFESTPSDYGITESEMATEPTIYSFRVSDELMSYPAYNEATTFSPLIDSIEGFNWGKCKLYSMPQNDPSNSIEDTFIDKSFNYGPTELVQVVQNSAGGWQFEHFENIPVHIDNADVPADGHHKWIVPLDELLSGKHKPTNIVAITLPESNQIDGGLNSDTSVNSSWIIFISCGSKNIILSRKINVNLSLYPNRASIVRAVSESGWQVFDGDGITSKDPQSICTLGNGGDWQLNSRFTDKYGRTHLWFQNSSDTKEIAIYSFIYQNQINVYAARTQFPVGCINDITYDPEDPSKSNQVEITLSGYSNAVNNGVLVYNIIKLDAQNLVKDNRTLRSDIPLNLFWAHAPILSSLSTQTLRYHENWPFDRKGDGSLAFWSITDSHFLNSTSAIGPGTTDSTKKNYQVDVYIGLGWRANTNDKPKPGQRTVIIYSVDQNTKQLLSYNQVELPGYLGGNPGQTSTDIYFLRGGRSKYGGWRFLINTTNGAGLISQSFATKDGIPDNPFDSNGTSSQLYSLGLGAYNCEVLELAQVPDFRTDTTDTNVRANKALFLGDAHVAMACNTRFNHDFEYVSTTIQTINSSPLTKIHSFNHVSGQWSTESISQRKTVSADTNRPKLEKKQFHQVSVEPINNYGYTIPFDNPDSKSPAPEAFYYEVRSSVPITIIDHNGFSHRACRSTGAVIKPITKHSTLRFRVLAESSTVAVNLMVRVVDMGNYVDPSDTNRPSYTPIPSLGSAIVPILTNDLNSADPDNNSTSNWFSFLIGRNSTQRMVDNVSSSTVAGFNPAPKFRSDISASSGNEHMAALTSQFGNKLLETSQTVIFDGIRGDGLNLQITGGLYESNKLPINPFLCVIEPKTSGNQLGSFWSNLWNDVCHVWNAIQHLANDINKVRDDILSGSGNIFDDLARIPSDVAKSIGVLVSSLHDIALSVEKVLSVIPGLSALFLVINAWFDYIMAVIRFIEMFFHFSDMIDFINSFKSHIGGIFSEPNTFNPPVSNPYESFKAILSQGKLEFDGAMANIINNSPFGQDQSAQVENDLKNGVQIAETKIVNPVMHLIEESMAKLTTQLDSNMNALLPIIINDIPIPDNLLTTIDSDITHLNDDIENTLVDLLGTFITGLGAIADPGQMINSFLGSIKNVGDDIFLIIEDIADLIQTVLDPNTISGLFNSIWSAPLVTLQIPILTDLLKLFDVNLSTTINFSDFFGWTCGMSTWMATYLSENRSMTSFSDLTGQSLMLSSASKSDTFLLWQVISRGYENVAWLWKYELKGPAKNNDAVKEFVDNIQLSRLVFKAGRVFTEFLEFYLWEAKEMNDNKQTGKLVYKTIAGHLDMAIKLATLIATLIERKKPTIPSSLKKPTFQTLKTANAMREGLNIVFGFIFSVIGTENRAKDIVHELGSDFGRGATFMTYSRISWNEEENKWSDIDPLAEYYPYRCAYLTLSPFADLGCVLLSHKL